MASISLSNSIFKLCTPALIYLVISVLVLVFLIFSGISALTLLMKSALIVLWTFLLNWLCSRGLGVLSWIILLLPVVLVVLLASWSVDVQSRGVVPSWSQTSMGNAAKVGGCSSCREGFGNAPSKATALGAPVLGNAPSQSPVLGNAPSQSPLLGNAPSQAPVLGNAPSQAPVVRTGASQKPVHH